MSKTVGLIFDDEKISYTCPQCGKEYQTQEGLEEHMAKEHQKEE